MVLAHHPSQNANKKSRLLTLCALSRLRGHRLCLQLDISKPKQRLNKNWRSEMIIRERRVLTLLLLAPFLLWTPGASAQENADHLVISQVCLESGQAANSWIEVYNPTDGPLTLQRLRLSGVRTINVLPKTVQDQGGIQVAPGQCLILCSDDSSFNATYSALTTKRIGVDALSHLGPGGFLAITTEGAPEAKGGVVRYGDPKNSVLVSKLAGGQVVGFSKSGKSYTRRITRSLGILNISDFVETTASPGNAGN